ncbi:B3 domain-containing protein [Quillaja saponaria]|uniref:B3 domain-containing protein n=1 Tax=Quillaja saponaria TaxID=32244 RepID=A0AAD7PV16_QUISA|nr:B3 domain-containing protein [Quillaja saponaria]
MSTKIIIFKKKLSYADVKHKLHLPSRPQKKYLPQIAERCNYVDFDVQYGDEQNKHTFRLKLRYGISDPYKRAVISRGWRQVARDKGFREGDELIFYKVEGDCVNFKFEVLRKMMFFGQEIWGTCLGA